MLKSLHIKNIGIIAAVDVEFGPGLNILTGETGAGKSMILSSLNLVLGGRADADAVKQGEENAASEAVFEAAGNASAARLFDTLGISPEGGEFIVRRTLQKEGKSRALVNGSAITVADLKTAGEGMVDIHGQHEHQSLMNPETHIDWLDGYLQLGGERWELASLLADVRKAEGELSALIKRQKDAGAMRDFLAFKLEELEKAALKTGEEAELETELKRLASSGKIRETGAKIFAELYEAGDSALSRLTEAAKEMEKLKAADGFFAEYSALFADMAAQVSDAAMEINSFCSGVEDDPARMEAVENRLALIERLKRKYRTDAAGLVAMAEEARRELDSIAFADGDRKALEKSLEGARKKLSEKAGALHKKRVKGIASFKKEVQKELADLNMAGAKFEVEASVEPSETGAEYEGKTVAVFPHGIGRFQFLISANEGQEPRPLAKIASGGEISRVMLALKTAVGKTQPVPVLVFDEIDSGIGGKTADMVGEKLKKLSKNCQIICITHLPQIARQADLHFVVEKMSANRQTAVAVRKLDDHGRVEELARMGAGKVVTDAAREHAREMIGK